MYVGALRPRLQNHQSRSRKSLFVGNFADWPISQEWEHKTAQQAKLIGTNAMSWMSVSFGVLQSAVFILYRLRLWKNTSWMQIFLIYNSNFFCMFLVTFPYQTFCFGFCEETEENKFKRFGILRSHRIWTIAVKLFVDLRRLVINSSTRSYFIHCPIIDDYNTW